MNTTRFTAPLNQGENHGAPGQDAENTGAHDHAGCHQGPALQDTAGSRLLATLVLNLLIPVAQIIGGVAANSVALISDAVHNFSDFTAILISYIAFRIGRRGATLSNTFGYRRAEILAALINVLLLTGASAVILYHAIERFSHPQAVDGLIVILLAGVGVVGNGFSAWLLHRDAAHSLNVRGAFLHMVGDLLTSVAVLINGILLIFYPWYWLDPLLSILIVVFILKNGWGLLKESVAVLMNATPGQIDLEQVRRFLMDMPGITGVHYLHAWQVSSSSIAFSCHVVVPDQPVSSTCGLAQRIRHELFHRFHIDHPVLQFETTDCGQGSLLCEMACNGQTDYKPQVKEFRSDRRQSPFSRVQGIFFHGARLFLGFVFLYAAHDKILDPGAFSQAVYNYRVLPDQLVNLTALVLPWLELLIGLCLVSGFWLPGATMISTGLMTAFVSALAFNLMRGLDVHCGCFSMDPSGAPADILTVLRDLVFLALSGYLVFHVVTFRSGNAKPPRPK